MKKIILVVAVIATVLLNISVIAQVPDQPRGVFFDEFVMQYVNDPAATDAALKAGEIEFAYVQDLAGLNELTDLGFLIGANPTFQLTVHFCNLVNASFLPRDIISDINFRRAIAHTIPKEAILEDYWGPMGAYEHTIMPPETGKWYMPDLPDITTFDPELAVIMLDDAGYTTGTDGWRVDPATGTKMRELQLVTLSEYTSIHRAWLERWEIELEEIGIPARVEYVPYTGGLWYYKVFVDRDWDFFYITCTPGPDPTKWFSYMIWPYWYDPEYVALSNSLTSTSNETEALAMSRRIQELVLRDVPLIPLLNPKDAYAYNPAVIGQVSNALSPPTTSMNAALRLRFKDREGGVLRAHFWPEPDSFIHGLDSLMVMQVFTYDICDQGLLDRNPLTGGLQPWIAYDWTVESWSDPDNGVLDGTKVTYTLRDDVYWHDGVKFTAFDVEFAARYGIDNGIPLGFPIALDRLVLAEATSETQIEFYFNKTSIFLLDNMRTPYLLSYPKHLYNPNATLYGEPEGLMDLQEEGKPGVPDPLQFAAAFKPHPNPPVDKPWLTCFIGVGPWMFRSYEWGVGIRLLANRDYFITPLPSDIDLDRKVDILDVAGAALAFGSSPTMPRWTLMADINGDQKVDIIDLASIAIDFGKNY